jgi:hypothetical protein
MNAQVAGGPRTVVQTAGNAAQGGLPAAAFADEVDAARSGDGHGKLVVIPNTPRTAGWASR